MSGHFADTDLADNRAGRLSPGQEQAVQAMLATGDGAFEGVPEGPRLASLLLTLGLPLAGFWTLAFTRLNRTDDRTDGVLEVLFAAFALLALGVWGEHLLSSRRKSLRDHAVRGTLTTLALEPKAGHVAGADGEVVWARDHYACLVDHHELVVPSPSIWRVVLAPGKYRVYYLAESGVLLGLEPIEDYQAERVPSLLAALGEAHRFDVAWLPDLRRGVIPAGVSAKLRKEQLQAVAALSAICLGMVAYITSCTRKVPPWWGWLGLYAAWLALLSPGIASNWKVVRAARAGRLRAAEGPARVTLDTRTEGAEKALVVIGDLRLQVSNAAARVLVEGFVYRAYYLAEQDTLVAIEPIGVSDA